MVMFSCDLSFRKVTACNFCKDMRRRDRRFNRRTVGTSIMVGEDAITDPDHPHLSETAIMLVLSRRTFYASCL
jgi:hypothetical protein